MGNDCEKLIIRHVSPRGSLPKKSRFSHAIFCLPYFGTTIACFVHQSVSQSASQSVTELFIRIRIRIRSLIHSIRYQLPRVINEPLINANAECSSNKEKSLQMLMLT